MHRAQGIYWPNVNFIFHPYEILVNSCLRGLSSLKGAYNHRYSWNRDLGRADNSQSLYIGDPGDATLGFRAIDTRSFADGRSHFFRYTNFSFRIEWLVTRMRRYHFISHNPKRSLLWLQAGKEKLELLTTT